jgi:hypothetical protein
MKPYYLKRRDEEIAIINLTENGFIENYKLFESNSELAPLHHPDSTDWLKKWWARRAVPISQGHIRQMLLEKGLLGPEDYLVKNLGLSLTDYYWISPIDSGLSFKDVNLFENDFHEDICIDGDAQDSPKAVPHYTPNGSLQGTLEKCWTIRNGKRGLLKGNRDSFSAESFNEIIATKLHELQNFSNYTTYKLLEIHGRPYRYGCFSELFTSMELELISAYEIETSQKKRPDVNTYEHFISVCASHGLPENVLRPFLEYQIMTDFILSNRDRHLSNISILRDANTLQFLQPAPIYDSGKSMFVNDSIPDNEKDMLKIATESFSGTELGLLSLVKDRSLVDITNVPEPCFIRELYALDSNMTESRINAIVEGYERKLELFTRWQKGEDFKAVTIGFQKKETRESLGDIFM